MLRSFSFLLLFIFAANAVSAQLTREQLEKQRQQLRKEIDETQRLLQSTQAKTKDNISRTIIIGKKVNLQERVVDNIGKDLHILDNNIYTTQRDINRYDRLLDTLKQEYAKSMVYSYKNRGNYEFLNFIFSADNFNDAIKRVSYLKSYRTYREMQGQNILRTQELRRNKLQDLGVSKQKKNSTLQIQSKEMTALEQQKAEQDRIVKALQKDAKALSNSLAAKKKQATKVNNLISAAIRDAIAAAKKEAADKAAAEDRARKADLARNAAAAKTGTTSSAVKPLTPATVPRKAVAVSPSVLLNDDNIVVDADFRKAIGNLPWPVDQGSIFMHMGTNTLPTGEGVFNNPGISISSPIGSSVKAIFDGMVKVVNDDVIIIQHGRYWTTYSNVSNISVRAGNEVKRGQTIGKVQSNDDGIGILDFQASDEHKNFDPEKWLRRR